jgi:hypothetical protein
LSGIDTVCGNAERGGKSLKVGIDEVRLEISPAVDLTLQEMGGAGFMTTEDMPNGRLFPKGIVEADVVNTGNPENMGHPSLFQCPDKMF